MFFAISVSLEYAKIMSFYSKLQNIHYKRVKIFKNQQQHTIFPTWKSPLNKNNNKYSHSTLQHFPTKFPLFPLDYKFLGGIYMLLLLLYTIFCYPSILKWSFSYFAYNVQNKNKKRKNYHIKKMRVFCYN